MTTRDNLEMTIKALRVYGIEPAILKSLLNNIDKLVKEQSTPLAEDEAEEVEICMDCKGELEVLKTTYGDPEGIRHDRKCKKCGMLYGSTKAIRDKMKTAEEILRQPKYKELKNLTLICEAMEEFAFQQPTDKWEELRGTGLDEKLTSWQQPTDECPNCGYKPTIFDGSNGYG